MKIASNHFRDI